MDGVTGRIPSNTAIHGRSCLLARSAIDGGGWGGAAIPSFSVRLLRELLRTPSIIGVCGRELPATPSLISVCGAVGERTHPLQLLTTSGRQLVGYDGQLWHLPSVSCQDWKGYPKAGETQLRWENGFGSGDQIGADIARG